MQLYEFKVIPAPRRGVKEKGVKTSEDRFALALTLLMNEMGAQGWDYIRADTLPCDERVGLTGVKTTPQHLLVFRRALPGAAGGAGAMQAGAPLIAAAPMLATEASARANRAFPEENQSDDAPAVKLGSASAPSGATPALGPAKPESPAE